MDCLLLSLVFISPPSFSLLRDSFLPGNQLTSVELVARQPFGVVLRVCERDEGVCVCVMYVGERKRKGARKKERLSFLLSLSLSFSLVLCVVCV